MQPAAWREMGPLLPRVALVTGASVAGGADSAQLRNHTDLNTAATHGGQILLRYLAADLAGSRLPVGITLHYLGPRRLPDFDRAEHVFQLVAPDLPARFPPLETVDRRRHNVPHALTPLLGREAELARA